ncbi:MAG: hypothetical protein ABIP78_00490 [Pyrinomonadaceae bacterium]
MADLGLAGLKGPVSSFVEEWQVVRGQGGIRPDQERRKMTNSFFDKGGNLTEIVYPTSKIIYKNVDGFRTFRTIDLDLRPPSKDRDTVFADEQPIEKPEKLIEPDPRFDFKYLYEYDKDGLITTERQYVNTGSCLDYASSSMTATAGSQKKLKIPRLPLRKRGINTTTTETSLKQKWIEISRELELTVRNVRCIASISSLFMETGPSEGQPCTTRTKGFLLSIFRLVNGTSIRWNIER